METEDALLPYPKKVKMSSTDASLTLPLASRTGVSQVASCTGVSELASHGGISDAAPDTSVSDSVLASSERLPTTFSVVSDAVVESSGDLWETSNTADSEAFWGCPRVRSSCPRTRTSLAPDELRCSELVASVTDTTSEHSVLCRPTESITDRTPESSELCIPTGTQTTYDNIDQKTFNKHDDNICTSTRDCLSICAQDHCDKVITHSATEAESVAVGNTLVNAESLMEVSSDDNDSERDKHVLDENDAERDTYVVDDTDDSEVDEDFIAAQPTWQTAVKTDPYPVKESLLLTLEEVAYVEVRLKCS